MGIIIAILVLSFLVIIHELGHFIAAKWAGVIVEEFGLGYPPKAAKLFHRHGTDFTLNWIPFGGFVRLKGEDATWQEQQKQLQTIQGKTAFFQQPAWKQLIVILAGAAINFLFGIIAFSVVYSFSGIPTEWDQPRITALQENSPAAQASVMTNANISAIRANNQLVTVSNRQQATQLIQQHAGETIVLITTGPCNGFVCEEISHEYQVYVRKSSELTSDQGAVGIIFQTSYLKFYPWYEMPFRGTMIGVVQAVDVGGYILQSLSSAVTQGVHNRSVPQELMSPVGIVDEIGRSGIVQQGVLAVLQLAGMISVNLAILNVMPIPALDGGRAAFIMLRKIINKKILATIESYTNYGGIIVLVLLLLFLSFRDIYSIITR